MNKIKEKITKLLTRKQVVLGISSGCLVLIFVLLWLWITKGASQQNLPIESQVPFTPTPQVTISPSNEPQVKLEIWPDKSGITFYISQIDPRFKQLEYELIYLAGVKEQIERGVAGGPIDIPPEGKISEKVLFGTESCTTGVCRRHIDKNVTEGTLLLRFIDEEGNIWEMEKRFET